MGSFLCSVNHLKHLLQYFSDNNPVKENLSHYQFLCSVHACQTKQGWNQELDWVASHPPPLSSFKLRIMKGNKTTTEAILSLIE